MKNKHPHAAVVLVLGLAMAGLHLADLLLWSEADTGFAAVGSVWLRYIPWLAAFALLFVSSLILSIFWTGNMIVIYLLHALVYCLYMVWQLYHSEFFTFSLVTASAGVVFYLIARTSYMANRIAGSALLALILIGTALTAFLCAKNHGKLNLGSRMLRLFPDGFNPLLFYFICVLWAVVLAACLIFGSGFAFYAMFAAIAVELIGAVYYTFQLK